jgi:hypothetical protein
MLNCWQEMFLLIEPLLLLLPALLLLLLQDPQFGIVIISKDKFNHIKGAKVIREEQVIETKENTPQENQL